MTDIHSSGRYVASSGKASQAFPNLMLRIHHGRIWSSHLVRKYRW